MTAVVVSATSNIPHSGKVETTFTIAPEEQLNTIEVFPSSFVVETGEEFIVGFRLSLITEVGAAAIDKLTWNPDVIECIGTSPGDMFPTWVIYMSGNINNTEGILKYLVIASTTPANGTGILFNVTFRAKQPGTTTIDIIEFGIAHAGFMIPHKILNHGVVTVV